jgi:hypothetical protein
MPKTRYFTSTEIFLELEDWYNAGLTSEACKEEIERMVDPNSFIKDHFSCQPMGINGNWVISTKTNNPGKINEIVEAIDLQLFLKLAQKNFANSYKGL